MALICPQTDCLSIQVVVDPERAGERMRFVIEIEPTTGNAWAVAYSHDDVVLGSTALHEQSRKKYRECPFIRWDMSSDPSDPTFPFGGVFEPTHARAWCPDIEQGGYNIEIPVIKRDGPPTDWCVEIDLPEAPDGSTEHDDFDAQVYHVHPKGVRRSRRHRRI